MSPCFGSEHTLFNRNKSQHRVIRVDVHMLRKRHSWIFLRSALGISLRWLVSVRFSLENIHCREFQVLLTHQKATGFADYREVKRWVCRCESTRNIPTAVNMPSKSLRVCAASNWRKKKRSCYDRLVIACRSRIANGVKDGAIGVVDNP